jgi:hypothetical protein
VTSTRELSAMAKRQLALRDQLWPDVGHYLWRRSVHNGHTTIPRTMPLVLKIMDEMTKGAPVSSTFLALWCSSLDNSFVSLSKPAELAAASGFGGQRGEHTWMGRIKKLQELRFIDIRAGKAGPMSHAIIWNPHFVIRWHQHNKTPGLTEESFASLLEWALDAGAKDMIEPVSASAHETSVHQGPVRQEQGSVQQAPAPASASA